jgi:HEAT repeat protein
MIDGSGNSGASLGLKKTPFRFGLKGLLVAVAACAFIAWSASTIWRNLAGKQANRLVLTGSASERVTSALGLRSAGGTSDAEEAVDSLRHALGDQDAGVRAAAIQSLAAIVSDALARNAKSPQETKLAENWADSATGAFAKALKDPEAGVRATAATGIESIGMRGQAGPPAELIGALKDESTFVRAAAAGALVKFAKVLDAAIPVLLSMLEQDELSIFHACSRTLLAAEPSPALVPTLVEAVQSRNRAVRFHAAALLGRIGPHARGAVVILISTLNEPFDEGGRPQSASVEKVINGQKRLLIDARAWDPACSAAEALAEISTSEEVVGALTGLLESEIAERRGAAAAALGRIGPPSAGSVGALIEAYKRLPPAAFQCGPDGEAVVRALGQLAPSGASAAPALGVLVKALDYDNSIYENRQVRAAAAESLAKFGASAVIAIPKLRALEAERLEPGSRAASAALAQIAAARDRELSARNGH